MWQLLILVLALALRLIYLFQIRSVDPTFNFPIMDALYHHEWAVSIIQGGWLGKDAFFRAPLYPHMVALLYQIFGTNLLVPRLFQCVIGAINCVLTARIGAFLFKKKVGIIAGIIASLYPLFIYFDSELLIPTILIFLVLLAFYLMLRQSATNGSRLGWFFIGIVFGLAVITRPNILLFLIVLPFWLYRNLKKQIKPALIYGILGVALMIAPITIRNYVVSKEFVLIAWQGGTNFYIGNNEYSDGHTAIVPGTRKSWWGGFYDAKRIAEASMGRKLENSEIDRYWMNKGFEWISREPAKAFMLFLKKTYLFFSGFEIPNNRNIYFFAHLTYLKFLLFSLPLFRFPFGLLFPLSLVGIFLFLRRSRTRWLSKKKRPYIWFILLYMGVYTFSFILFFVCARYRLPIIPFLIMFATFAILYSVDEIRKKKLKQQIVPLLLFIGTYVFFNADIFGEEKTNPALDYLTMGTTYKKMGRIDDAMRAYAKAIEANPNMADGYYDIGNIYADRKDLTEARKWYLKAIEVDPHSAEAHNNLGNIYFETGMYDKALEHYQQAHTSEPNYESPLYHAGLVYKYMGNYARAESLWVQVLDINPNNKLARRQLDKLHHE